mmetsp:Transcript_90915/g.266198  ORF Transcript_90915/g.266198 Transcript_90915/m.266198 type:complete len:207 (+) Transcript_90915:1305-1925(+)
MLLLFRSPSLLVRSISKGPADRQVTIDPCDALEELDVPSCTLNALSLVRIIWLVVSGETAIRAGALYYRAIRTAKQHAAVADVAHAQLALARTSSRWRDNCKSACRAAWLPCCEELAVKAQHQLLHSGIVPRRSCVLQLLCEPLHNEVRTLVAAVAIENTEESPRVLHDNDMCILHVFAPAIHLSKADPKERTTMALHNNRRDRGW